MTGCPPDRRRRRGSSMTGMRDQKTPWGVVGAIVAILAVELGFENHDLGLTRPECINWRFSRKAAIKKSPGCDVLCLGTSMVQGGVLPRVIEQETGRKTYNLAVCAGRV